MCIAVLWPEMFRPLGADRKVTVTPITSLYKCDEQKRMVGSTVHESLGWMSYNSIRHITHNLNDKNRQNIKSLDK